MKVWRELLYISMHCHYTDSYGRQQPGQVQKFKAERVKGGYVRIEWFDKSSDRLSLLNEADNPKITRRIMKMFDS